MSKQQLSNALHIGGSLETALNGQYNLNVSSVVQEAVKLTQKHFWHFLPATAILIIANTALFLVVLAVQQGNPFAALQELFSATQEPSLTTASAVRTSLFISTVVSAPLYAGASLMGLSHAIGFRTKPRHIIKGLAYGMAAMSAMCFINLLQNISNQLIPLLGLLIGISLSMTVLLICEKKLSLFQAMRVSFQATLKKFLPFCAVYLILGGLFLFCYATAGIALIWVLPFMFNVKGVLYREMFGVGIEVVVTQQDDNNDEVFHA